MRYGFIVPKGDPRIVAGLAREAEDAGWDGVFYFDAICIGEGMEIYDPWVVMSAIAMRTERVRLGAILTPPARRRPWKLARETVTLDHLSGGRGSRRTTRSARSCWTRVWRS
ncbi:MAG: LLM class flavin-dependent oxidoreductase [Actinobacteria bacterium]|nr:LLM class flavin-dependent oxidoreductase [Actinomycetota bacterium]